MIVPNLEDCKCGTLVRLSDEWQRLNGAEDRLGLLVQVEPVDDRQAGIAWWPVVQWENDATPTMCHPSWVTAARHNPLVRFQEIAGDPPVPWTFVQMQLPELPEQGPSQPDLVAGNGLIP